MSEKDSEYNDESYIDEEQVSNNAQTKMSGFNFKDFKKKENRKEEEDEISDQMDESIVEERGQMQKSNGLQGQRKEEVGTVK